MTALDFRTDPLGQQQEQSMVVHLIDKARLERRAPKRRCTRCRFDLRGHSQEGECPECGDRFGYVCKRCDYPLTARIAGNCSECGRKFDKGKDIGVRWRGRLHHQGRSRWRRFNSWCNRVWICEIRILGVSVVLLPAVLVCGAFRWWWAMGLLLYIWVFAYAIWLVCDED